MPWFTLLVAFVADFDSDGQPDFLEDVNGDGDLSNDDTDADGLPDYQDADDDNDGADSQCEVLAGADPRSVDSDGDTVTDDLEILNWLLANPDIDLNDAIDFNGGATGQDCVTPWDRDSDGVPNMLDPDDDGDGLLTGIDEIGTDGDCIVGTDILVGDGIPDYLDVDSDDDGVPDVDDGLGDDDLDHVPNFLDCVDTGGTDGDSDGDGVDNLIEVALCSALELEPDLCVLDPDFDGDAVIDGAELAVDFVPFDTDYDGMPDYADVDDDGDAIPSRRENGVQCAGDLTDTYNTGGWWMFECYGTVYDFGGNSLDRYPDTDGDELPDFLDVDDDGDSVPTAEEGEGDLDCDDLPNYLDPQDADGPCAPTTAPTTTPTTETPGGTTLSETGDKPTGEMEPPKDEAAFEPACGCAAGGSAPAGLIAIVVVVGIGRRRRS